MNKEKLEQLAKDLRKGPPRSPREVLGGYVILSRCLDKGRADLMGINGEYNYWYCSLCAQLEEFTGVDHAVMKEFIATGATDDEVGEWFKEQSKIKDPIREQGARYEKFNSFRCYTIEPASIRVMRTILGT